MKNNEFKKWFRSILVNTSIDYHRKYNKLKTISSEKLETSEVDHNTAWENLLYGDLLKVIQLLSPGYRVVFNLYAIDGYKHQEIAEQLNISVGTSRSNYAKARKLLQGHFRKNERCKKDW